MPARIAGVALVFVPMALAGPSSDDARAAPLVVVVALGEVLGNVSYVVGGAESIASRQFCQPIRGGRGSCGLLPLPRAALAAAAVRRRRDLRRRRDPDAVRG